MDLASLGLDSGEVLDLPDVRQEHDWDCGAACARAVAGYFRLGPESAAEWLRLVEASEKDGTAPATIVAALTSLGLDVIARSFELFELGALIRQKRPVIVAMQPAVTPTGEEKAGHYAVVIGLGLNVVILHDPAEGRLTVPAQLFVDLWYDQDATGRHYRQLGIVAREP